jgi:hypothetical protein
MLDAAKKKVQESKLNESTKVGTLRGGSSGCISMNKPLGSCPRLAALRFSGIQVDEPEESRGFMFDAGLGNEDIWYSLLETVYPKEQILREEEIPITWEVDGTPVTGRPDIVLTDSDKKPLVGIELKLVSSFWTARGVLFNKTPKTIHLTQAGFYSLRLDVPFELWYTSRVDWPVTCQPPNKKTSRDWMAKMLPTIQEPLSEHVEYTFYVRDNSNAFGWRKLKPEEYSQHSLDKVLSIPKKVKPFTVGYRLEWNKGQLRYKLIGDDGAAWVSTVITAKGIEEFYRQVASVKNNKLPQRVSKMKADGSMENYSVCDYCSLKGLCDVFPDTGDWETWKASVLNQLAKGV